MITNSELTDLPEFDSSIEKTEANSISLSDVFVFILDSSKETNRRIIDFAASKSGLCSIQEAAKQRNIKPPTYCQNKKYEKFYFIGKTFGIK